MRKYVIFDLDGTLLDSMYIWKEAGALFLKEKGIEAPKDLYEQLKAMSLEQAANYLKQQFHLSLSDAEIIAGIKAVVEKQYTDYVSLKPFVRDYLKRLNDRHIRMCIVTASEYEHAEAALQRLGILDCFDFIVTCSQAGIGKDNPVIFLKVAERWGAQPHEVAVFEDALHAVETAKTAGFFTIGVYDESAQDDQEEMKRIADLYINDFYEVSL
ncbi:HAD family phosphatase [Bacillus sp. AGMB 02131]|uniref:HAD family phosphatase n=1 Tax=Peribacillus faecalis TaxID=2772559 RepID=A0A927HD01_9BACI|nr:HAD family phosphatase [Peribacillus faecalis]MBD3110061.1 HAD family phosphatase [Peribacillus faecalis]